MKEFNNRNVADKFAEYITGQELIHNLVAFFNFYYSNFVKVRSFLNAFFILDIAMLYKTKEMRFCILFFK